MMHFLTTQICKNKYLEKGDSIVKVVRLFFGRMTGRWVEEGGTHEEEAELISNVSEERSELEEERKRTILEQLLEY